MADDGPNPKQRRSKENLWWGMGLGIFGLILLLGIVAPDWLGTQPLHAPKNACINNLRQIDVAKQQWAFETHAPSNAIPTWDNIRPYLGRDGTNAAIPKCPMGGIYTIGSMSNAPTCSIKGHVLE